MAVETALPAAKVIVNARTGSIVMNQSVTLEACAVAHGNLTVTIQNNPIVSQPGPLSNGQTVVVPSATIDVKQESNALTALAGGREADRCRARAQHAGRNAARPDRDPAGHESRRRVARRDRGHLT